MTLILKHKSNDDVDSKITSLIFDVNNPALNDF